MPAIPVIPDFGTGIVPGTALNQLAEALAFAMAPPKCKVVQTAAQSIPTGVTTSIDFSSAEVDPYSMWDAGLPSRVTAVYPGYYQLGGGAAFVSNATSYRLCRWAKNGSVVSDGNVLLPPASGVSTRIPARATIVYLDIDDYIELQVLQATGSPLNTGAAAGDATSASVTWIGQ